MKPDIFLPNRNGNGENEIFSNESNIVIIGANGAGKTRLGAWIETTMQESLTVHRISAQRALNIPEYATIKNLEQALKGLQFGREDQHGNVSQKRNSRWGSNPETHLLQDFDQLLSTLFAYDSKRDRDHTQATIKVGGYVPVDESPIDIIKRLWTDVMPHREISFEDSKVIVKKIGESEYHGKEMSDGERVTLYLIGQCLCAPDNSIIIIDEPELHLHKSLMSRLWNKIEELCPNKLFIFITHDLDFAASRKEARKIWIKSYDNTVKWLWEEVPEIDSIPENLVIEIIGNRKNIIFCEGEKSSYDYILYQAVFSNYLIVPRGGCKKVIESTKAARGTPALNHLKAFGIIDGDYRLPAEIQALKKAGIHTIDVAEIENLFCIEKVLKITAKELGMDSKKIVTQATDLIYSSLKADLQTQIANYAEKQIQFRLNAYTKSDNTEKGLRNGMKKLVKSIDVKLIISDSRKLYKGGLASRNLEKMLKLYNSKNLHQKIAALFGLKNDEYIKTVLRLLKSEMKNKIITAIKKFLPKID